MPTWLIKDLTGGQNSFDPAVALPENQVVTSQNMDYAQGGMLGARRAGQALVTTSGVSTVQTFWTMTFIPREGLPESELWAVDGNTAWWRKTSVWAGVTVADTIIDATFKHSVSLHNKFFLAYRSGVDRLHVWQKDSSTFRRTGLAAPGAAPTATNAGTGSATGTRYYRVRYTLQTAFNFLRSEPSAVLTFSPSGANAVRVTKPGTISENETHWELEASSDNANFYRIATIAVGTTTYDDNTDVPPGYALTGVLSEAIGDYSLIWSARFVVADDDRLVVAGDNQLPFTRGSRIAWTPVSAAEGVTNDERIPTIPTSFMDIDADESGVLTNMIGPVNGFIYASKINALYRLTRTGNNQNAYIQTTLSKKVGGTYLSMVEGTDEQGAPCVYFWDPAMGPMRYGTQGLQWCGEDIWNVIKDASLVPAQPVTAIYDSVNRRVLFAYTTPGGGAPTVIAAFYCPHGRSSPEGVRGGWSIWSTNPSQGVLHYTMFADNVNANTTRSLTPAVIEAGGRTVASSLFIYGSGESDVGPAAGRAYRAYQVTRPYQIGDLINRFEIAGAVMLADPAAGVSVRVRAIRDYGVETKDVTFLLTPAATETQVMVKRDQLMFSELMALQFEIGDASGVTGPTWALNQLALTARPLEETV